MDLRLPRFATLAWSGAIFALLHLLVNMYHAAYYGVEMPWSMIMIRVLIVGAGGGLGYLAGSVMLARDFKLKTLLFIAIFGYFVSYSIANLLGSMLPSPWLFVVSVPVVTAFITIKIGPKWEPVSS